MSTKKDFDDILKALNDLAKESKNSDFFIKAIERMQNNIKELLEENGQIKDKLKHYEDLNEIAKRIKRTKGIIADFTDEFGESFKICTVCWACKRIIIPVEPTKSNHFYCPKCDNVFWYGDKEERMDLPIP